MAGIRLLDRDDVEQAADARFERPDAFHVRQAGFFHPVPKLRGANHSLGKRIVGGRTAGARDAEDRVVAVIYALDAEHRRVFHARAVVAEPLAEGAVGLDVAGMKKAFDGDFRVSGKRQAGDLALDEIVGPPPDAAAVIVFRVAELDGIARGQEQQRILTDAQDDRTGLPLLEIFFHVHAPVLAGGRHEKPDGFLVMHHGAIGAEIQPAFVGIPRDRDAGGADESAAVELMHFRHGELEHIDGAAGHGVLEDRSAFHDARRHGTERGEFFFEPADELQSHAVHRQARHQRQTAIGSLLAEEDAKAFGIAFDLVEEKRRNRARALAVDELRDGADLEVPIGAVDALELSHRLDDLQPFPHVVVRLGHRPPVGLGDSLRQRHLFSLLLVRAGALYGLRYLL